MLKPVMMTMVAGLSFAIAAPVAAQSTAPNTRTINVTYTGTVVNDVTGTIMLRQPDGTTVPYTGPRPDYPYRQGDTVTISFDTLMPTKDYNFASTSADGIYRFRVQPTRGSGGTDCTMGPGFGCTSNFDVSGPMERYGQEPFSLNNLVMVYDSNTDQYHMELASGRDQWSAGGFVGPGFSYDPATGALTPGPSTNGSLEQGIMGLVGTLTDLSFLNTLIFNPVNGDTSGYYTGPRLTGGFSVSGGGTPTDVPAPPVVLLFAGGIAALGLRMGRKRKLA